MTALRQQHSSDVRLINRPKQVKSAVPYTSMLLFKTNVICFICSFQNFSSVLNDELRHNMALSAHKKIFDEEKMEEAQLWKHEVEMRKEEDRMELLQQQKLKREKKYFFIFLPIELHTIMFGCLSVLSGGRYFYVAKI